MSCVGLLPLCSVGVQADREGRVGANAYQNIIGVGIYYPSGKTLAFPQSFIPQDTSRTYQGEQKPGSFAKGYNSSYAACPIVG